MTLSKSLYTRGIQCPKSLWLKKYKPDVLTAPNEAAQAIFETGNVVGDLACGLFTDGREVPFSTNFAEMIATTDQWLKEGLPSIFEATFNFDGILVMVDILHVTSNGVEIYEVKSSTSVKDIYLHDVSIQYYVLTHLGFDIKSANVIHIDKNYVRGDELDLDGLFSIVDVTEDVMALQENIPNILEEFETCLSHRVNEPDIEIGKHCKDPYECDAKEYCWRVQRCIPNFSIFNIFNLGSKKQIELYEQGVVNIDDIPEGFAMTANQKQAVENYKSKETHINQEAIKAFLETLSYPVYHLDFETFQQAVPQFKGIRPFMQIPFQYSLHVEHSDGSLEHREFLAQEGLDQRELLARKLCENIPSDATVLAYNMSFEKGVITQLASNYEELGAHLLSINENMKDLMTPFQQKHYATPGMQGSYSIKHILPAIVPEMEQAYKELDSVQNGGEAMNAFANMSKLDDEEKQKMRDALLAYCKLDTLAMVMVLGKLRDMI
jgi:hypothetical protein